MACHRSQWLATDPVDRDYRAVLKPPASRALRIRAAPGLGAAKVAALNALLKAQARTVSLEFALATAINRYSGAALADNAKGRARQRAAARHYAKPLAASLAKELTDDKAAQRALTSTALHSHTVNPAEVQAFKQSVVSGGLSQSLGADLSSLRIPASDFGAIRFELERASPTLIATHPLPVTEIALPAQERAVRGAIAALRAFARSGR